MMKLRGLPHSEIPGYASTRLTEAYRSVATSFIGPRRQGIHPAPILVCTQRRPGLRPAARAHAGGERWRTAVWRRRRSRQHEVLPGEVRSHEPPTAVTPTTSRSSLSEKMMSTKTYGVGKVHRREAPRGGATGPVNHRSAPVSAGADRGSLGGIKL